jgi:hypothetical protein
MKKERIEEKLSKPQMNLIPGSSLLSVARVLGMGAVKHGPYSWKSYPPESYIGAIGRHYAAILDGEVIDEESGETHYAHIACSAMFLDWLHHNTPKEGEPYCGKCEGTGVETIDCRHCLDPSVWNMGEDDDNDAD